MKPILTRVVRIRASDAKMRASRATTGIATKAASVVFQGKECVLHPGLPDLLEALGVEVADPAQIGLSEAVEVARCRLRIDHARERGSIRGNDDVLT